jgi:RNA polymerase sigma factor (sigma-70 family)
MAERRRLTLSRGAGAGEVRLGMPRTGVDVADDGLGELGFTADAESTVVWRETLTELSAAVAALPAGLRAVLVLRDIQGASTRETAHELGVSEDVVKQRLHRARAHLRRALDNLAIDGPAAAERG